MTAGGNVLEVLVAVAASAVLTSVLTGAVRAHALRSGLKDVPNDRSSHSAPTPRGGGLAIAVVVLGGGVAAALLAGAAWPWAAAIAFGGAVNAAVGWADDRSSLSVRFRLMMQLLVGAVTVVIVGPCLRLELMPGLVLPLGIAVPFVFLYLTWMTNLFNFMDGIDGIAGVEASTVGLTVALGSAAAGHLPLALMSATVAGSGLGFLTHNWPPAKIFMGDVGSSLLGFALGVLGLWAASEGAFAFPAFLIAMSVFVVDATMTLFLRALRAENVTKAHRSHAYQNLTRRWGSHRRVSLAVLVFNLCLLLPSSLWADLHPREAWMPLAIVWSGLGAFCLWVGAGRSEATGRPT